jgi:hypothetical protein
MMEKRCTVLVVLVVVEEWPYTDMTVIVCVSTRNTLSILLSSARKAASVSALASMKLWEMNQQ